MSLVNRIRKLSRYGTSLNNPLWLNRNIVVANNIALFCSAALFALATIHGISHPEKEVVYVTYFVSVLFLSIPFLHRMGYFDTGRTLLTFLLLVGSLLFTITRKMSQTDVSIATYYQSRIGILVFSLIPLASFHFREKKFLIINLTIGFLSLLLFDPIHNLVGVGYYQKGFTDPDYYYSNIIILFIFFILHSIVGFFKKEMDGYGQQNEELIAELHARNHQVTEQKEELRAQGEVLKELLKEKDQDLSVVTQQLININHELVQYSYTISHNLRGPVARILGLVDVLKNYSSESERANIVEMINSSTLSLDEIIHDLNKIVEIRGDNYTIRERVGFQGELNKVQQLLSEPIRANQITIITDFKVSEVFGARQQISFILFSLLSNAIQYRREDQRLQIKVSTRADAQWVVLEVEDNGKGIDMLSHQPDLFKPFRQFHPEASGKGISLYLVKLQAEKLDGRIEVKSAPGKGAKFSVYIKDWQ